ncbi:MAG TPA: ABC transporter ATP-binding protein [Chloroflexota bacterium]|nr:ABC transporter ATP-binding protein [Chloroflexota bacterium]
MSAQFPAPANGASRPLLSVEHLSVTFAIREGGLLRRTAGTIQAVSDVSFDVAAGETLGLVGESGCGKTTTGRAILQIVRPTGGRVYFEGEDLTAMDERELRPRRRKMQLVFQDPFASLNPRMPVGEIVAEPLAVQGIGTRASRQQRAVELLHVVGLASNALRRFPHEFSGGQRQRIAIARALALRPELLVLDEPISALDVSIQAQIITLLEELQKEYHLTYLFIAHDLAVVRYVSDRVAVMYLGKVVEIAPAKTLYQAPVHPYTAGLLAAVPVPDPARSKRGRRTILGGDLPSPARPPAGCRFHTRCPRAQERCRVEEPALSPFGHGHLAACHFPLLSPDEAGRSQ